VVARCEGFNTAAFKAQCPAAAAEPTNTCTHPLSLSRLEWCIYLERSVANSTFGFFGGKLHSGRQREAALRAAHQRTLGNQIRTKIWKCLFAAEGPSAYVVFVYASGWKSEGRWFCGERRAPTRSCKWRELSKHKSQLPELHANALLWFNWNLHVIWCRSRGIVKFAFYCWKIWQGIACFLSLQIAKTCWLTDVPLIFVDFPVVSEFQPPCQSMQFCVLPFVRNVRYHPSYGSNL
jgi:hypothetical protein